MLHANSTEIRKSLFILEENPSFYILKEKDNINFEVYIDPSIKILNSEITFEWEGNISFYWLEAYIPRYKTIEVTYKDS